MFEKVNPCHPDKVADRIAGALVDMAYRIDRKPKIAVEVLIGHGLCTILAESSVMLDEADVKAAVTRIAGDMELRFLLVPQDAHLAANQEEKMRCGDNGIFKGVPLTSEEKQLAQVARQIYAYHPTDGKYILDGKKFIVCQSNAKREDLERELISGAIINPLGDWTGGTDVDSGATNRKLGSDMAQSVTGGGLHGKDLSKADVSVNIYAFRKAQRTGTPIALSCAIGDEFIDGKPYHEIVDEAAKYIASIGGFEKFAEWGLV